MKYRKFAQNKLWRDKVIEFLENDGSVINTKNLSDFEFDTQLRIKLLEEAAEVKGALSRDELIEEIADVYEVIDSISRLHNISIDEIKNSQNTKLSKKGGFTSSSYVTTAEHKEGSLGLKYCLNDPDKYPEIIE